jgi:beta-glucosidase
MKCKTIVICALVPLAGWTQTIPWIDFNRNGQMEIFENPAADIENRVNNLISLMTVQEKISLLNEVAPAIPRLGVPKYDHGNEALHGVVRPGKFTVFPQAIGLSATWNPDLIYRVSDAISDEARARWNELGQGKDQKEKYSDLLAFWSPTVNMARDPRWGRTPETYGEDPYLTSRIGVAFVRGLQGNDPKYLKVVSTPKHFAANNEEHNRFECNAVISERALRSYYLPAFKALVTEGKAAAIMSSYNAINGVPNTANRWLLTDVLRNEWGFDGYVVSDCGAPGHVIDKHKYTATREDAAAVSMKAGLDLECSGYCPECYIYRDYLPRAYDMGKVTGAEIDRALSRVLKARFKLGLFDDPSLNPYTKIPPSLVGCPDHQQLALETARQSIVLLKNEKSMLPLDIKKLKRIAVLGINANTCEFGDYSGVPLNNPVSPFEGISKKAGPEIKVETLPWLPNQPQGPGAYTREKKLAAGSDLVIAVMGINKTIEMEGLDRTSLELPSDQTLFLQAIHQVNKNIIVVLVAGSSLAIPWIQENIPAIVNAWYPGEQGGNAIADVLFGDYNPAGRLPLTFYNAVEELPPFDDYDVFKGRTYMYFEGKPLYPFGYGLSYSTFEYSNISVEQKSIRIRDTLKVTIDIKNMGPFDGDEVVQLYLRNHNPVGKMPDKRLRAFQRISLKAGEVKTLTFSLTRDDLAFWNSANEFELKQGIYKILVGASSADIRQEISFDVVRKE